MTKCAIDAEFEFTRLGCFGILRNWISCIGSHERGGHERQHYAQSKIRAEDLSERIQPCFHQSGGNSSTPHFDGHRSSGAMQNPYARTKPRVSKVETNRISFLGFPM